MPTPLEHQRLDMPDGEVVHYPALFDQSESDELFRVLLEEIDWQHVSIRMFGKTIKQPRLTAWYGDPGKSYSYSGTNFVPLPWTPTLQEIKHRIEPLSETSFNSVLLNRYRDGQDSVGWHSDDERELGTNPVIGSVWAVPGAYSSNIGETSNFALRSTCTTEASY